MKTSIEELGFEKVKKHITNYCSSEMGVKFVNELSPLSSISRIDKRIATINDTLNFLKQKNYLNLAELEDTESLCERLEQGEFFSIIELLKFARNIQIANRLKNISLDKEHFTQLFVLLKKIKSLPELEKKFDKTFGNKGEIKDSASKKLAHIRKRIKITNNKISSKLDKLLNERQYKSIIYDRIITKRDNRHVIPVKAGSSSILQGIIHGRSQSAASVYLEPLSIVENNNEIIDLYDEEKSEIRQILKHLFLSLQKNKSAIISNQKILKQLDFMDAAANFFIDMDACVPEIIEKPILILKNARHPLLYFTKKTKKI